MAQLQTFDNWAKTMGINTELMTPTQLASLHANYCGRSEADDSDHTATATSGWRGSREVLKGGTSGVQGGVASTIRPLSAGRF